MSSDEENSSDEDIPINAILSKNFLYLSTFSLEDIMQDIGGSLKSIRENIVKIKRRINKKGTIWLPRGGARKRKPKRKRKTKRKTRKKTKKRKSRRRKSCRRKI